MSISAVKRTNGSVNSSRASSINKSKDVNYNKIKAPVYSNNNIMTVNKREEKNNDILEIRKHLNDFYSSKKTNINYNKQQVYPSEPSNSEYKVIKPVSENFSTIQSNSLSNQYKREKIQYKPPKFEENDEHIQIESNYNYHKNQNNFINEYKIENIPNEENSTLIKQTLQNNSYIDKENKMQTIKPEKPKTYNFNTNLLGKPTFKTIQTSNNNQPNNIPGDMTSFKSSVDYIQNNKGNTCLIKIRL